MDGMYCFTLKHPLGTISCGRVHKKLFWWSDLCQSINIRQLDPSYWLSVPGTGKFRQFPTFAFKVTVNDGCFGDWPSIRYGLNFRTVSKSCGGPGIQAGYRYLLLSNSLPTPLILEICSISKLVGLFRGVVFLHVLRVFHRTNLGWSHYRE